MPDSGGKGACPYCVPNGMAAISPNFRATCDTCPSISTTSIAGVSSVTCLRRDAHGGAHLFPAPGDAQRRALNDGALEEGGGFRRRHEVGDGVAAGGLPEGRDPSRVAAEGADVALHPAERLELVQQAEVRGPARARCEVAEQAQAVRHGHHDDPVFGDEGLGVEDRQVAGAGGVGPAVEPHHHGDPLVRGEAGRDGDGEPLAVLTAGELPVAGAEDVIQERHRALRARRRQGRGREDRGPVRCSRRRLETSRRRIGDSGGPHDVTVTPSGDRTAGRTKGRLGVHKPTISHIPDPSLTTARGPGRPL